MRLSLIPAGLALVVPLAAGAQPTAQECEARLERAHGQYEDQQFAEVERLVVECVDRLALPASHMDDGFRLLTLAYLRENLLAEAQSTVIKHLAWSFNYEPDDVRDPPLYVALFRVIKAQLTVPPAALIASSSPTGAPVQPVQLPPADPEPAHTTRPLEEEFSPPTATPREEEVSPLTTTPRDEEEEVALDEAPLEEVATRVHEPLAGATDPPQPQPTASETSADDEPVQLALAQPSAEPGGPQDGVGLIQTQGTARPARYAGSLSTVPGTTPPVELLTPQEYVSGEPLDFATVMPEIVGGQAAIRLEYPAYERLAGIEGRVVIKFVVGVDGKVSDVEILRSAGAGLDQAAMEAFERLEFTPGRQNGQPVAVRTTLTFHFSTGGDD